ncbi:hypothetical protein D3C85_1462880 [compost metagenome]
MPLPVETSRFRELVLERRIEPGDQSRDAGRAADVVDHDYRKASVHFRVVHALNSGSNTAGQGHRVIEASVEITSGDVDFEIIEGIGHEPD